jgi:hypothetical protein
MHIEELSLVNLLFSSSSSSRILFTPSEIFDNEAILPKTVKHWFVIFLLRHCTTPSKIPMAIYRYKMGKNSPACSFLIFSRIKRLLRLNVNVGTLPIGLSINQLASYLLGRHFIVRTGHSSIQYIFDSTVQNRLSWCITDYWSISTLSSKSLKKVLLPLDSP